MRKRKSVTKIGRDEGYKVAARVTLTDPAGWSKSGRRAVARWLIKTAEALMKEGDQYSKRFTAWYWYKARP